MKGPGTIITEALHKKGIKPKVGCQCWRLKKKMDKLGPKGCEENLDELVEEMSESIKEWRKGKSIIPQPPSVLVRTLINWAISQSFKSQA